MGSKEEKLKALDVYLEQRKTRQYVGRLTNEKKWIFEYSEAYLLSSHPIPVGPELPVTEKNFSSNKLFPSFEDRIPSKRNPAYSEYCKSEGISPDETDPLVLLTTIGRKGPSSFIFIPVYSSTFDRFDLIRFRKSLKLSIREFAMLFNVSSASIHRIESGKVEGKEVLKRIEIYEKFPEVTLFEVDRNGEMLHTDSKEFVELQVRKWLRR